MTPPLTGKTYFRHQQSEGDMSTGHIKERLEGHDVTAAAMAGIIIIAMLYMASDQ